MLGWWGLVWLLVSWIVGASFLAGSGGYLGWCCAVLFFGFQAVLGLFCRGCGVAASTTEGSVEWYKFVLRMPLILYLFSLPMGLLCVWYGPMATVGGELSGPRVLFEFAMVSCTAGIICYSAATKCAEVLLRMRYRASRASGLNTVVKRGVPLSLWYHYRHAS